MTFNVRRAHVGDLERLIEFTLSEAAEAEGVSKSADKIREGILNALKDETVAQYWVLENAGEVIGNVSVVKEWSDWNAGHYWWIQGMYLALEYRGQGLMTLLLAAAKDSGRQNQALDLRLYVRKDNVRAIDTYLKSGFRDSDYRVMVTSITAYKALRLTPKNRRGWENVAHFSTASSRPDARTRLHRGDRGRTTTRRRACEAYPRGARHWASEAARMPRATVKVDTRRAGWRVQLTRATVAPEEEVAPPGRGDSASALSDLP